MIDLKTINYEILDRPQVTMHIFHPRHDWSEFPPQKNVCDLLIPVEQNTAIGARFYLTDKDAPNILFFHGNGEIVSDYDDLGKIYNKNRINFLAVDYRGYGRSSGNPNVTFMMKDSHIIFEFIKKWLNENIYSGPLIVMGRSLGSASALELAYHYQSEIDALVIESGFAYSLPLLKLLGVDIDKLGFKEEKGFSNIEKIKKFNKPTLIIHAEHDHIIPFTDGLALYNNCSSFQKTLLKIARANHNDIFYYGLNDYMEAVSKLAFKKF